MVRCHLTRGLISIALCFACVSLCHAKINLEWRLISTLPCSGGKLEVGLYAVSDNDQEQSTAAIDVVLRWDPAVLTLTGKRDDGSYKWLSSSFPNDSKIDNLNKTFADGDALYEALARLGEPAYATPDGLHVTTMLFDVSGGAVETQLEMVSRYGRRSKTIVYDGEVPGKDVTGTIETEILSIPLRGDCNCDGGVNFNDIDPFVVALIGEGDYDAQYPDCAWRSADANCDGAVDFMDIDAFVECLLNEGCL